MGVILLLAPLLWGATFPATKVGVEAIGVFPFMFWTRLLGFVTILAAVPLVARREVTRPAVRSLIGPGLLLGALIFAGYVLQTEGLARTTATNAVFITGLYVVFAPLLGMILFRRPVARAVGGGRGVGARHRAPVCSVPGTPPAPGRRPPGPGWDRGLGRARSGGGALR